ncbi:MAG: hypothetical protein J1D88_07475 [Treponema sp.]|nr:hypothetical protein [Treponema sp.]
MKKIIALVAAAALSATVAFAEKTIHIGVQFPFSDLNISGFAVPVEIDGNTIVADGAGGDFSSSGAGGSFGYTYVADSGFTSKFGVGLAGISTSDIRTISGKNLAGVDFDLGLGLGGSFIHNERMTLSLTGDFGFQLKFLSGTESQEDGWGSHDIDTEILSAMFYIGPELSYTFRFGEHVGMFVSLGYFYNIGSSTCSAGTDDIVDIKASKAFTTSGFSFHPKFGLSISF